jgi:hypothetical protein
VTSIIALEKGRGKKRRRKRVKNNTIFFLVWSLNMKKRKGFLFYYKIISGGQAHQRTCPLINLQFFLIKAINLRFHFILIFLDLLTPNLTLCFIVQEFVKEN